MNEFKKLTALAVLLALSGCQDVGWVNLDPDDAIMSFSQAPVTVKLDHATVETTFELINNGSDTLCLSGLGVLPSLAVPSDHPPITSVILEPMAFDLGNLVVVPASQTVQVRIQSVLSNPENLDIQVASGDPNEVAATLERIAEIARSGEFVFRAEYGFFPCRTEDQALHTSGSHPVPREDVIRLAPPILVNGPYSEPIALG